MDRFAARNLMDGVEFTGGIGEEDKTGCWQKARLQGPSLSSEEGWGLAVNEYLASNCLWWPMTCRFFRRFFPTCCIRCRLGIKLPPAGRF